MLLSPECLDRRLDQMSQQIDLLLGDAPMHTPPLDAAQRVQLYELAPRLKALCTQLARYAVLPTLVQGDLHLGTLARPATTSMFFDWTDGCVAHPFLIP